MRAGELEAAAPLDTGLAEHLRDLMFDQTDVIRESFDRLPECLKTLLFYRAYEEIKDKNAPNDPQLGEKAYFRDATLP